MRLGIGSYTFTWAVGVPGHRPSRPWNVLDLLDQAERLGVNTIQYCDNLPLTRLTAAEWETFSGRVRDRQLFIEIGTRGLDPENLRTHLRLARLLNAPFVRLVIDRPGAEPSPAEAVAGIAAVLPEFAAAGVKLAIENHDRFPATTLASIVRQLGEAQVGICLDTVNSFGALERPKWVVEVLGPYVVNLHVKDFTVRRVSHQMGFVVEGCPAGQGQLNVPWLLETLRTSSRGINAILELWTPPAETLEATLVREQEWADASVRYLRKLIPR